MVNGRKVLFVIDRSAVIEKVVVEERSNDNVCVGVLVLLRTAVPPCTDLCCTCRKLESDPTPL